MDHFYDRKRRTGTFLLVLPGPPPGADAPYWLWHYPGPLAVLEQRWPELTGLQAVLRGRQPIANAPSLGELTDLTECSLGALMAYMEYADGRLYLAPDAATIVTGQRTLTLPWP